MVIISDSFLLKRPRDVSESGLSEIGTRDVIYLFHNALVLPSLISKTYGIIQKLFMVLFLSGVIEVNRLLSLLVCIS